MNRREFLKLLGIGTAATAAPPIIFDMGKNLWRVKSDYEFAADDRLELRFTSGGFDPRTGEWRDISEWSVQEMRLGESDYRHVILPREPVSDEVLDNFRTLLEGLLPPDSNARIRKVVG